MYSFLESTFSRYSCSFSQWKYVHPITFLKQKASCTRYILVSYPKKHGHNKILCMSMSETCQTCLWHCCMHVHQVFTGQKRVFILFYFILFLDIRHGLSLTLSLSFSLSHTVKLSQSSLLPSRFAPSLGQFSMSQSD